MTTTARRKFAAREHAGVGSNEAPQSAVDAGKMLREILERNVLAGKITSVDLAILAYYSTLAGAVGLEDYSVNPKQAEKHGAEHVELILAQKYERPNIKLIEVPANSKKSTIRETMMCPIRLPSQILSENYKNATHIEPPGSDASVVSLFQEHPIVKRGLEMGMHWSRILGVVLYTDGVKYTTRDSFVGFFMTDYRTMHMYLCALFRKDDACKCGCRGWCTIFPILLELALDLRDSTILGFLIACLMTKGDWPAYCEIAGVRQWFWIRRKLNFKFCVHATSSGLPVHWIS
jgi:hypothetical protein